MLKLAGQAPVHGPWAAAGAPRLARLTATSQFTFEDWQLLAGLGLGLFAAVVATLLGEAVKASAVLFGRLKRPGIAKSMLGRAIPGE